MAIVQVSRGTVFIGLSGDSKPTDSVLAGSTFIESDTGNEYLFDGSAWFAAPITAQAASIVGAGSLTILAVKQGAKDATAQAWLVDGSAIRRGTVTNRSGTITAGDTSQQLAAVNASRKYLFVQNVDASEDLWINFTSDAVIGQPSILIKAGASFVMDGEYVSTEKVTVIAHTTNHAFVAKEG